MWSDPATLLPAAAVLKPAPPRPPPRCRHHPCTADAAATLPSVAALLLQPSHYRRVAVAPSIACAVALLSHCPSPPLLIDCCIFPHGACCSRDGKGWLRSREAKIPQRKLEFWSPEENGAYLGNNVACFATFVCKFFFILSVFSSSHTHLFWRIVYYFHHVTTIFLALSETKYLLATPTVTHISEVTEEFYVRTYGTLVDVGKSRQKKCVGIKIVSARRGHFGQK